MTYRETVRHCPGCRSAMEKLSVGKETIDRCTHCKGIFLDYFDGEPVVLSNAVPSIPSKFPSSQRIDTAEKLSDWLLEDFKAKHGEDLFEDEVAQQRCLKAAERALSELDNKDEVTVNIPFITVKDDQPLHLVIELSEEMLTAAKYCSDCDLAMHSRAYLDDGPKVYRCGGCLSLFASPEQWEALSHYEPPRPEQVESPWWSRLKLLFGS